MARRDRKYLAVVRRLPETILALTVFVAVVGIIFGLLVRDDGPGLSAAGLAALSALLGSIVTGLLLRNDDDDEK
jgi:membrane associated rhomboid family serine protease